MEPGSDLVRTEGAQSRTLADLGGTADFVGTADSGGSSNLVGDTASAFAVVAAAERPRFVRHIQAAERNK